jgi:hypothetical protein
MKVFVKILRSQESGYSGDKPNQRGKYILIPQVAYSVFPVLSTTILNDSKILKANTNSGLSIGLNIVYHNAKHFPRVLTRDHNEIRIYRNVALDNELSLDRNVVIIMVQNEQSGYAFDSVQPIDKDYEDWCKIARTSQGTYELDDLKDQKRIRQLIQNTFNNEGAIVNSPEVIKESVERFKKARKQQPSIVGDPSAVLSSLIKSQSDFSKYLRDMYDNKCAIRQVGLVKGQSAGLDAAHIQAHTHNGPLLPSNGFLLSSDLHQCFDRGFFGLSDDNRVIIRTDVPKNSELHRYDGLIIKPSSEYELFSPYYKYNQAHRLAHNI